MSDKEILDWMEDNLTQLSAYTSPDMGGFKFGLTAKNPLPSGPGAIRSSHRSIRKLVEEAAKPK